MILEVHDRLGNPLRLHATRLVARNDQGTPIALAMEITPGHIKVAHVGDREFQDLLSKLGMDRTVLVTTHDLASLRPPTV